ncbi:radical SAM protein [Dechloromonas sp. H13]|uniref:radical SAM protein n=1 Tax=Dechloromonas sp. H13 TaxID=2570193 RepID=UPI00129114E4|nr:radical SAM protein [Dechloromonas sp. H13]
MLTIEDHRRDSAGLRYVYPVISRRAGGVSVGINLNVNNACNWACVYCQVDGLTRGGPPPIDLDLLERELAGFLDDALHGDFMAREVPAEARRLMDVAFSGNGEPTSAFEFPDAVRRVRGVLENFGLAGTLPVRLITNGSLLQRPAVQEGIRVLGELGGEVWFKVDRATAADVMAINGVPLEAEKVRRNLESCASLATTWVQTCWFALDGQAPDAVARDAYCGLLKPLAERLAGIHLYGLARPSQQPAAPRLQRLAITALEDFAEEIQKKTGIRVLVSP